MVGETTAHSAALDRTLMALADPTRAVVLQRLSRGPARVTEVAQPFAISLNSVSKHTATWSAPAWCAGGAMGGNTS